MTMMATTMTAINHDEQLGEIYPMMLNELNCVHLALVFHVFIAVAVMVMVCDRRGLWPLWLWPSWFVAVMK